MKANRSKYVVCFGGDYAMRVKPCVSMVFAARECVGDLKLSGGGKVVEESAIAVPF